MRRLYDFQCENGHVHEALEDDRLICRKCPLCQADARRVILVAPRIDRLGIALGESASPESIDYFEKVHKQQKAIEEKAFENHGDYGPRPGAD